MTPQEPKGEQAQADAAVQVSIRMLEHSLVAHGSGTPKGKAIMHALSGLTKAFGKDEGVVVDTHVRRVAGRLGLTRHEDPVKIEADLMRLLPRSAWGGFSFRLILHGRAVCRAARPGCDACFLADLCPYPGRRR